MEVILLEKIGKLGGLGDKVSVKAGFGRNYLIPQGKAVSATEANMARFEERRAELEKEAADKLASATARGEALEGLAITIAANAGDEGQLFGSIGSKYTRSGYRCRDGPDGRERRSPEPQPRPPTCLLRSSCLTPIQPLLHPQNRFLW